MRPSEVVRVDRTRRGRGTLLRRLAGAAFAFALSGCVVAPAGYPYGAPPPGPAVDQGPPAPQYEAPPAAPGVGYVWIGGYWAWQAGRHVWIGGRWVLPPAGYVWAPGWWARHPHGWAWHGGYWARR